MNKTWTRYELGTIIRWVASNGFEVLQIKHKGSKSLPCVYRNDRYVRGFKTVREAKKFVETSIDPRGGQDGGHG